MKRSVKTAIIVLVIVGVIAFIASVAVGAISTLAPAPQNVYLSNTCAGINLNWDKQEKAEGYYVYKMKGKKHRSEKIGEVKSADKLEFIDEKVESGKKYQYFIKSFHGKFKGKASSKVEDVYLSEPEILYAKSGEKGVEVKWEKVTGATGYKVYRSENKKLLLLSDIKNPNTVSFMDEKVDENKRYNYTVVAYNGDFISSHSFEKSDIYLKMPKLLECENSYNGITIKWSETTTAEKYNIYCKINDSKAWKLIDTVDKNTTTYEHKDIQSGNRYTYTVRAKNQGFYSGYDEKGLSSIYLNVPDNGKAVLKNNEIIISWDAVKGANKYKVYKKGGEIKKWKLISETAETKLVDKGFKIDETYDYTIRAVGNDDFMSKFVNEWVTFTKLGCVSNLKANNEIDGVKLSWSKKSNAEGYIIYRKISPDNEFKEIGRVGSGSRTTYWDYNVKNKETYIYNIKPFDENAVGSFVSKDVSIVFKAMPRLDTKLSPNGVRISWNETDDCVGYEIYRKSEDADSWTKIASTENNVFKYLDEKPIYGKRNYYKLMLIKDDGEKVEKAADSVFGVNPNKPMVALTYDDGPNIGPTNRILDLLEKYNSRATFFIVGERLEFYGSCVKREARLHCEIGNHTYNHKSFSSSTVSQMQNQLEKTNNKVEALTGVRPKLARAPGGAIPKDKKPYVGMPLIQWSVDTLDWKSRDADSVIGEVKRSVGDGSIVLMHDLYESTASASETIIPWLIKNGYQLVTVSEMMDAKGINMKPGEVYFSGR